MPDGLPADCPLCGGRIVIAPSMPAGDAPCPRCGCLLWFAVAGADARVYPANALPDEIRRKIESFQIDAGDADLDSLDFVEFVMELEDLFELDVPDETAESFESVHDVLAWLIDHFERN